MDLEVSVGIRDLILLRRQRRNVLGVEVTEVTLWKLLVKFMGLLYLLKLKITRLIHLIGLFTGFRGSLSTSLEAISHLNFKIFGKEQQDDTVCCSFY